MDNTFLNSLLCGVNAGQAPQLTWGRVNLAEAVETRMTHANSISVADFEQALALLAGELAGLTVGQSIYPGEFAPGADNAFVLAVTDITPVRDWRYLAVAAKLSGKFTDRMQALATVSLLQSKLPLPEWISIGGKQISQVLTVALLEAAKPTVRETVNERGRQHAWLELELPALIAVS